MIFTSATANKKIKQLTEKKERLESLERDSKTYVCATDEEPVVPDYDYNKTAKAIDEINSQIVCIKHALNLSNTMAKIEVNGNVYSVDEILVKMAQLNKRKAILSTMIEKQPKQRVDGFYNRNNNIIEYEYINYDLDTVKADYEKIDDLIVSMQLALDKYNQTVEFEVEGIF